MSPRNLALMRLKLSKFPGTNCLALALALALLMSGCATRGYVGTDVETAPFLSRSMSHQESKLIVTTAVPNAQETEALTGLDLYDQGIQPIWLKVENTGSSPARIAMWSIDSDYFSPIEVAYMNRKKFSGNSYGDLERWFYSNGMPRQIPPGESRSGLVFTHLRQGTKGFNLNIFNEGTAYDFTFFVPMPGFVADFMEVDFASLYPTESIRDLNEDQLRTVLEEELSCCATDPTGELAGGPLNTVLVATPKALRRSLLRGDWIETASEADVASRARLQHYEGRRPDAIFTKIRPDGNERIQIHLWLAPWRVDSEPVWLGQVFYWSLDESRLEALTDLGISDDTFIRDFFAKESVTADLDNAQRYLFQSFWYSGSLSKVGFVKGVGEATVDEPRSSFGGAFYVTDGQRVVVFLSEDSLGLDDGEIIYDFQQPVLEIMGEAL